MWQTSAVLKRQHPGTHGAPEPSRSTSIARKNLVNLVLSGCRRGLPDAAPSSRSGGWFGSTVIHPKMPWEVHPWPRSSVALKLFGRAIGSQAGAVPLCPSKCQGNDLFHALGHAFFHALYTRSGAFTAKKDNMENPKNEWTGLALQRGYFEALGIKTYGPEDGPFIVLSNLIQQVWIFGTLELEIIETDFENQTMNLLMEHLQKAGAVFSVALDGTAHCNIGSAQGTGQSYAVAGMRAGINIQP